MVQEDLQVGERQGLVQDQEDNADALDVGIRFSIGQEDLVFRNDVPNVAPL